MRLHCLYAALVLTLAFASPALAYLDPGTGSMLVSALVGIVATLFFLLKGIYCSASFSRYAASCGTNFSIPLSAGQNTGRGRGSFSGPKAAATGTVFAR